MSRTRVSHVVRHYGGLTEPFIDQRIKADADVVVWFETGSRGVEFPARRVEPWPPRVGSLINRAFFRVPQVGLLPGLGYREAESIDRPAVIHAHYLTTAAMVGPHTREPMVASAYGFDVSVMARRALWRAAYRRLIPRLTFVLAEGPFMAARVRELGFTQEQVALVPISVDTGEVPYRSPDISLGQPLRLLSCGRLVEKKGHDTAMLVFARAGSILPEGAVLEIVGSGPLLKRLITLAKALRIDEHVKFHGALNRSEYLSLLARSDILLAASRTAKNGDSEGGAPTTILDAQARGVVVVASSHADLPFLVQDGQTGFLAQGESVAAMLGALTRAVASSDDWRTIARKARRQVEDRHSREALTRRLGAVYAAAVAR